MNSGSPFTDYVGIEILQEEGGVGRASMAQRPEIGNRNGGTHGGAIATLIDVALGRAVSSLLNPGQWCATIELKVNYLLPAVGDMECTATVIRMGRQIAVAEADVIDTATGKLIAKALSTYMVRER
ncbi:MAG: PaaI family thioesterase [Mycobacterium leprae]